ncbi:ADP-heptose:LPS heptosyltransferase [Haloferula luteola]|uniref:ADP-heptose:LPS heptosyltransferase n=1 Tax=Haloferula luteola TaxID=595692 RepID=A0A840VE59_9BACT|nr:glycosyltransferase family 9 protein [Haloferula luteola]MBB5352918.1 ADP-heptose:LPS heptosyltransferase [Haloferula luteola]
MTLAEASPLTVVAPLCGRAACFSLPAVRALTKICAVTVLHPESQAFLWSKVPGIQCRAYADAISKKQAIALFGAVTSALFWEGGMLADAAAKAGVADRVGLPSTDLAKRLTRPLERKVRPGPVEHEVRRYLDTVQVLGAEPLDRQFFEPLDAGEEKVDEILLAPASSFGSPFEWPLEQWTRLVEGLKTLPISLRVLVARDELATWADGHQLPTVSGAEIGNTLRRTARMISADSPAPHFAAAFGAVCAVLYGPGDPSLHRPLGKQHRVIRHKAECAPCFSSKCALDLRCQRDLTLEEVVQGLDAFTAP